MSRRTEVQLARLIVRHHRDYRSREALVDALFAMRRASWAPWWERETMETTAR